MTSKTTKTKAKSQAKADAKADSAGPEAPFGDVAAMGRETLDAMLESGEAALKAAETLGSEIAGYSAKSVEEALQVAKDIATAATPVEAFEKQTAFAKTAFDGFLAQAARMNELYMAAAREVTAPLGARMTNTGTQTAPSAS